MPLALLSPARAADAEGVVLRWRAPTPCPSEPEVRAEVGRLVARSGASPKAATLRAEAQVNGAEGAWRVRLRTDADGVAGEKWLEAPSCRSLAEAVALVVALAYDPQAAAAAGPPPAEAPATDTAPADPSRASRRLRPTAHVAVAANAGALPVVAPGFAVGAGVATEAFRFEAAGSVWSEQTALLSPGSSAPRVGGQFELWAAGARACYGPQGSPLWIDLCAFGEAGRMAGRGLGVTRAASASFLWGAVGAGVTGHWALAARLGLRGSVEGLVPLARPTFVLDPYGDVFRPSPLTGRASLGVEAFF